MSYPEQWHDTLGHKDGRRRGGEGGREEEPRDGMDKVKVQGRAAVRQAVAALDQGKTAS